MPCHLAYLALDSKMTRSPDRLVCPFIRDHRADGWTTYGVCRLSPLRHHTSCFTWYPLYTTHNTATRLVAAVKRPWTLASHNQQKENSNLTGTALEWPGPRGDKHSIALTNQRDRRHSLERMVGGFAIRAGGRGISYCAWLDLTLRTRIW